jgi:hypothetical protein
MDQFCRTGLDQFCRTGLDQFRRTGRGSVLPNWTGSVLSNRPWISSAELVWISFAGLSHVPKADGAAEAAAARCVHDPLPPRWRGVTKNAPRFFRTLRRLTRCDRPRHALAA